MSSERIRTLLIRTPEGIEFSLPLAGPMVRFLAALIDTACISCAVSLLATVIHLFAVISLDFARAVLTVGAFLLSLGYGISLEWYWRGQTLGKRLLRLRVMDEQGLQLRFGQVVLRNLLRPLDMFPALYLLGGAVCFFDARNRRLGDMAAGTIVIRTPDPDPVNLGRLSRDRYNSLLAYPRQASRLRRAVTGREASIVLRALLRRDEMNPEARGALFSELAGHLRSRVPFPSEAYDGISDERYLRNVLDVMWHSALPGEKGIRKED
jgi:uncharacterized RDD family membrane protein YckC